MMKHLATLCFCCFFSLNTLASEMPLYHFKIITPHGAQIPAQEVSGLNAEAQIIEYRHSNSDIYGAIKMPGIAEVGQITIRRMTYPNSSDFWDFYDQIEMNTIPRENWKIQLANQSNQTVATWQLLNAWPTKVNGTSLMAAGRNVNIDSMTLAFERMVVTYEDNH